MEKDVEINGKRKALTIMAVVLVFGIIASAMIYKGSITSRVTGDTVKDNAETLTAVEAANKLTDFLNKKYGYNDVKFLSTKDLGSMYMIIITHAEKEYAYYVTKEGKYYTETIEKIG